jgi:ligand-binding sensor domain-containing protein/signal transduction histidine kinase
MLKRFNGRDASCFAIPILALVLVYLALPRIFGVASAPAQNLDQIMEEDTRLSTAWVDPSLQNFANQPIIDFDHLSIEDGLPHNSVFTILQDNKGFMWFGTLDGLTRYDGYDFVVYTPDPDDLNSLSDQAVMSIIQDRGGDLWIGTGNGGLNRFDSETKYFHQYTHQPDDTQSVSSNNIFVVFEDSKANLWVGTSGGGLNRYQPEGERFIRYQNDPSDEYSLSSNNVLSIYEDQAGTLWIGTAGGGLNKLVIDPDMDSVGIQPSVVDAGRDENAQQGAGHFVAYRHDPRDPYSISQDDIYSILEDRAGRLWLGTGDGSLNLFDRQTGHFKRYPLSPGDIFDNRQNPIRAIVEDLSGVLWVAVDHEGLFQFDPDKEASYQYSHDSRDPKSLSSDNVRSLYIDRSGLLWVGTYGGGLNKHHLVKKNFNHYRHNPDNPNSLSEEEVSAIYEDRSGILWIGTYGGGLNRLDRESGKFTHYTADPDNPDGINVNIVLSIHEDSAGNLWIGTAGGGLNLYDRQSGNFIHYRYDPTDSTSISSNTVGLIYEDRLGYLWIGTYGGGLSLYNREKDEFIQYQHDPDDRNSLSSNFIQSIYEDRTGALWIGTNNGLNQFRRNSGEFIHYVNEPIGPSSAGDNDILSIYEDQSGVLWVGTNGSGLGRFDRDQEVFSYYSLKEGLSDLIVYGILEDRRGYIWLSTSMGLSRFDPKSEIFKNYDSSDGLPVSGFNHNAYFKNSRGEMYFGGMDGFVAFFPETIRDDSYIPPIELTRLTQGGQALSVERSGENMNSVTLKWPNNFFEFEFVALSYVKPENNQYTYKLEGYEETWSEAGSKREGRYVDIPGGEYTLQLKGSNHDGIWNEEGLALRINVVPPFWETNWFQGGLTMLLVISVVVGYRLRVRRIQARTRELEATVQQRTYELERRRQVAEGLGEIMVLLNSNKSLEESLNFIVTRASELTGADYAILFRQGDKDLEMIEASYPPVRDNGFINERQQRALISLIAGQVQGGVPFLATRLEGMLTVDPSFLPDGVEKEKALMCLPIHVGGERYGGLALLYQGERLFSDEDVELGILFSDQAALAIGNAQLRDRVQEMAVVEERNRLARDLHDAVTQTLFSASLIAEALPDLWKNDPFEGNQLLEELRQLSRGALAEMRTLLLELRPASVAETRLIDLIRQMAESTAGRTGMTVKLVVDGESDIPPAVKEGLYRITQEGLNNIVKHSHAKQVAIRLKLEAAVNDKIARKISLCIEDDGCGFEPDLTCHDQLGLGIMNERAEAIGAILTVDSIPGCGTRVSVSWKGKDG